MAERAAELCTKALMTHHLLVLPTSMADARPDKSYEGRLPCGVPGEALRSLSARRRVPSLGVATAADVLVSADTVAVRASIPDQGRSLATLSILGRCEAGQDLFLRLLRALRRLHSAGLVHGSVNATNVLVGDVDDGTEEASRGRKRGRDEIGRVASVSLTGLEFVSEAAAQGASPTDLPGWRAPEQELGAPATAATDAWQAAMTLLCSLSDAFPRTPPAGPEGALASTMLFGAVPEVVARKLGLHKAWKSANRAGASPTSLAPEVLAHHFSGTEAKPLASLLAGMLNPCPESRVSVEAALAHAGLARARRVMRLSRATR